MPYIPLTAQAYLTAMVIPITVSGHTEISGGVAAMAGTVVDTMDGEGSMVPLTGITKAAIENHKDTLN